MVQIAWPIWLPEAARIIRRQVIGVLMRHAMRAFTGSSSIIGDISHLRIKVRELAAEAEVSMEQSAMAQSPDILASAQAAQLYAETASPHSKNIIQDPSTSLPGGNRVGVIKVGVGPAGKKLVQAVINPQHNPSRSSRIDGNTSKVRSHKSIA